MQDIDYLIMTLTESLKQTKKALNQRLELQAEIRVKPNADLEELEQIEAEISTLKNAAEQTELAIASLSKRKQNDGFDEFKIGLQEKI